MPHESKLPQENVPYEVISTMNLEGLSAELPNGLILSIIRRRLDIESDRVFTSIATVIDPSTGEKIFEYDLDEYITRMKVLSNSEIVIVNEKNQIRVLNINERTAVTISEENTKILSLKITSKNEIVTLHKDSEKEYKIKIWEIGSKTCLTTCTINSTPYTFTLVKDRFVITRHQNNQLTISDLLNGTNSILCSEVDYYTITPNGHLVSSHKEGGNDFRVWDIETKQCIQTCFAPSKICRIAALSNNLVITGHWDVPYGTPKTLCLWDINTGRCLQTQQVNAIVFDFAKMPNIPYFLVYKYEARHSWRSFIQLWALNADNQISCVNYFPNRNGEQYYFWKAKIYNNGRFLSRQCGERGDQLVEFREMDYERLKLIKNTLLPILHPTEIVNLVCDYYSNSNQNLTLFNPIKKRKLQESEEAQPDSHTQINQSVA